MSNLKNLLNLVTDDIVISIMSENGSPLFGRGVTSDGHAFLIFKTICHGGDSEKLYYYSDSKTFHCWTNCGTMNFFTLIKKIRHISDDDFKTVVDYVSTKVGYSNDSDRYTFSSGEDEINFSKEIDRIGNLIEQYHIDDPNSNSRNNPFLKEYDEKILNYFDKNTFYEGWMNEGISVDTMKKYEISYYWLENHIIIPHRDANGRLIGIRRRSLKPEDARNKYMPEIMGETTFAHSLGVNLYGLYHNKDVISKTKSAVIVEGEKSVLLADTYYHGISNVVATCGFNISDIQINELLKLNVNRIYLGFDKDFDLRNKLLYKKDSEVYSDFLNYVKRLTQVLDKLSLYFNVKILVDYHGLLGPKDSPLDKGKDVYEQLLNYAEYSQEWKKSL